MEGKLKVGDRVRISSAPIVDNNEYRQLQINSTVGKTSKIYRIYENGNRNIWVSADGVNNYYNSENLELIKHHETNTNNYM
jgi:hypothetical protein